MTVGTARMHDSAPLHVSGQAQYCDDIVLPDNALHAAFGMSPIAHGRITALDLAAVAAAPGDCVNILKCIASSAVARDGRCSPARIAAGSGSTTSLKRGRASRISAKICVLESPSVAA